jgi:hypothetical protein
VADVGLFKNFIDPKELFRLEYPIGAWRLGLTRSRLYTDTGGWPPPTPRPLTLSYPR